MCSIHTCKRFEQEQNTTLSVNPHQTKNTIWKYSRSNKAYILVWICFCLFFWFVFYVYATSFPVQALDVQRKLNCCTGILLESFDQLQTVASNKDGLLYGVPVSIKENIEYKVASFLSCVLLLLNGSCTTKNIPLVHLELGGTLFVFADIGAILVCFCSFPFIFNTRVTTALVVSWLTWTNLRKRTAWSSKYWRNKAPFPLWKPTYPRLC